MGVSCITSSDLSAVDCFSALDDLRDGNGINRWFFLGASADSPISGAWEPDAIDEAAG